VGVERAIRLNKVIKVFIWVALYRARHIVSIV